MTGHRIFSTPFAAVYPLYVEKAKRKGRTKEEVDRVICWLTGYDQAGLLHQIEQRSDFETFFARAPAMHPNSSLIKGVICGVRVEEVQDPLMQRIRKLDKLVDELAKGKTMEKIPFDNESYGLSQRCTNGGPCAMTALARDVAQYERWLRTKCKVIHKDLKYKHERMREDAFVFLRATYFRWARTIDKVCPDFSSAPRVLGVGDTHVENFGTWRDGEARLVWGVNDFDEAATMPYPYDLVRLLTSARLSSKVAGRPSKAADAVLMGYVSGLEAPGPVLLDQGAPWLRTLIDDLADKAKDFWAEVDKCKDAKPPPEVERWLRRSLPDDAVVRRFVALRKGSGGLGRPRYLAIAEWRGGQVLREAKAMVPSAWNWAHASGNAPSKFLSVALGKYRAPDPSFAMAHGFLLRREAPDAHKLDLAIAAKRGLGLPVLEAMGREIGSIHAAHGRVATIIEDLAQRDSGWLNAAAKLAKQAVEVDHQAWLKEQP
ncbi:MAG TPA: DUF2200 family protein [Burkholderiaceae bacterium]